MYRVLKSSDPRDARSDFRYPVLEHKDPAREASSPDSLDEYDAVREAEMAGDEILSEARKKAGELIENARAEAEQIRQQARDQGFAEGNQAGYEAGFREGEAKGQEAYLDQKAQLEKRVADWIREVEVVKDRILEKYMDDLKEIVLAIGEKIVRTSLRSNSRVIEKMIVAATEKLKKTAWAKIYVGAQQDGGIDIDADPRFLQELSRLSDNVKVIIMDGQEPGTCIVERPDEIIDISVGTQLENIREIMNNARL